MAELGDPDSLRARLAADPNDHEARFDVAKILNVQGEREQAADFLLHIMKADRQWQDDGARKQLLTFLRGLGADGSGNDCGAAQAVITDVLVSKR